MSTTLPVPIEFSLPDGWRAAPPDEVGAPGVAFIALHPRPEAGFTANITIDGGFLTDEATLERLADASADVVRESAQSVAVVDRRESGSDAVPGLTQTLAVKAVVDGVPHRLVQTQVYTVMADAGDPHRRAMIRTILTVTAEQYQDVLEDFQAFLRTVRPDTTATEE
ncbi:hypothetical protein ACFCXT_16910 [Streptomyces vinaceus]|uniref:hypothetical protein n=1 Tax=Streptomyces vinaceus TaxID=1960 RepID=UPI0035DF07CE